MASRGSRNWVEGYILLSSSHIITSQHSSSTSKRKRKKGRILHGRVQDLNTGLLGDNLMQRSDHSLQVYNVIYNVLRVFMGWGDELRQRFVMSVFSGPSRHCNSFSF